MAAPLALPLWTVLPFMGLLLAIAILPLAAPGFWESNRSKGLVASLLALPVVVYLLAAHGAAGGHELLERGKEYISFMVLLAAVFVVTGGIYVRGSLSGTPLLNTCLLGIGALLASAIGTTGASALLIRPLLRANLPRERKAHIVVFFIFVVSNCGGLLTPLGDPPLFLGFLKGVPFGFTLRLVLPWALVNGALLAIFNVWDQIVLDREERELPASQLEAVMEHEPLRIDGAANLGFLAALVAILLAAGGGVGSRGEPWPFGVQEALLGLVVALSYATTPAWVRSENGFRIAPLVEVGVLFAGIFVTMAPTLLLLNANAQRFGLSEPWHFFWAAGSLSSFLDNAPTYLAFAATACGLERIAPEGRYLAQYLTLGPHTEGILAAISLGAVCMGANSYVGNGPNFMVKAIAEESGIRMPSFFGYMAYSGLVLIPLFVVVTFVFF